jgi:hypothetical protein
VAAVTESAMKRLALYVFGYHHHSHGRHVLPFPSAADPAPSPCSPPDDPSTTIEIILGHGAQTLTEADTKLNYLLKY